MRLAILHPRLESRDCQHCLKYQYNESNGELVTKWGVPQERYTPAPCQEPSGCPKGTPDSSRSLTYRNKLAWLFHRECRAVGSFPDDDIVRRNALIIEEAEAWARELQSDG